MGPLEIQAEKVLFFRCKSDFFREKTTFFSKHVGKKVLKISAFVKCGTFCWNVEFVEFCSISWILPKKAKMTENRHFWKIDPGRGIALISSLMPASPYFPHWSWAGHRLNPINFEIENVFLHRPFQGEASPWNITEFTGIHVCCYVILQNSLAFMCVFMYSYDRYVNFFFEVARFLLSPSPH